MSQEKKEWSWSIRCVVFLYASEFQAYDMSTGRIGWRAFLVCGRDFYPCIRNLLVHLDLQQKTFSPRMLRSSHHQLPILHSSSAGILSDMPTFSLQLESFHSRNMRRPEVRVPIYWGLQLNNGHYYRSFTIASPMGPSDADRKEDRFECPILHGYSVWMTPYPNHPPLRAQPGQDFANFYNSICIISLVRIKVSFDINATNSVEQSALISLLTCLESLLGVVNACLPVSKPAFDKLRPDSLISALSSWTWTKRGATSCDYEMPVKPKEITWPVENRRTRKEWKTARESITSLPNAVWSPPSSPRKGFE